MLDLPATLAPGLTLGEFILLFEIEERTVDETLCAALPLRVEPFQNVGGVEVSAELTLGQLIQGVFHWSAPCNFSEELEPWDRERLHFPEFSPGVGSLEESVGLAPDGANDPPTGS